MDYLLFLTGLFLSISGFACLFLYRQDGRISRWPMLAAALAALGFLIWTGILDFALDWGGVTNLALALFGAIFAAALLGFCMSPLTQGPRAGFALKWAAIVALFGMVFINGSTRLDSPGFYLPIIAAAFAGGWRIPAFSQAILGRKKFIRPFVTSALLGGIAAISLLPEATGIAYDIHGHGHAPQRVAFLAALCTATVFSVVFCVILWSAIYQSNRDQLSRSVMRRRRLGTAVILAAAVFTTVNGAWLAHWLGNQARQEQTSILLSALHLGANNLDTGLIAQIEGRPQEIGKPAFNTLRSKLLEIRDALPRTRFCYLLGLRNDRLVFLVDAEDPSKLETFSFPGDPVEDFPDAWQEELEGQSTFTGPDRDKWGVWFSAAVPIYDRNEQLVALLGIDYPAAKWLQPLAARRASAMGVTLSVSLLLVALFSFHLISVETARRVETLSEGLSDAMAAANLDTWECFIKPFKLNLGSRISATLGWVGPHSQPSFRKVWQHIHPEDRSQLLHLVRQHTSSEVEVRLMDATGRWLWFALRGHIVLPSDEQSPARLVGTILNIDERHRADLEIDKQRRFAQHLMETVPSGLAVVGADGLVSYANPAFHSLSRSQSESLTGTPIHFLIPAVNEIPVSAEGSEAILSCRDGHSLPVQIFRAPLSETNPNAGAIFAVVDLTAAKNAEQALLSSRD